MVPQRGGQFPSHRAGNADVQGGDGAKPLHGLSLHMEQARHPHPVPARQREKAPGKLLLIAVDRMFAQGIKALLQLGVGQRRPALPRALDFLREEGYTFALL